VAQILEADEIAGAEYGLKANLAQYRVTSAIVTLPFLQDIARQTVGGYSASNNTEVR
jgi:hypothetical protein